MPSLLRLLVVVTAMFAASVDDARAACNLIPGTAKSFAAALGATNRPYAAPGERVEIRLRHCDASSGFLADGDDHVVTLMFQPSAGGNRRAVVLAADCSKVDLDPCSAAPGVVSATCQEVASGTLQTRLDLDQHDRRLSFVFPDTDALLSPDGDDATLSGPVAIGVTAAGTPPACGLATAECSAQSGLLACVDGLYANDGACGTAIPDARFSHFTALPPPNDYQADCFNEDPPCTATAGEVRMAVDAAGNLLMPMGWGGILVRDAGVPVPRLIRTRFHSPFAFTVPAQVFLHSFTPEGGVLPPILEPQLDPTVASNVVTFFGSADAPYTILTVARHHGTCVGGDGDGARCTIDLDCKGGACETSCVDAPATLCTTDGDCTTGVCGRLFDFGPAVTGGGPVVLPRTTPHFCQLPATPPYTSCTVPGDCPGVGNACVAYAFEANSPVPLEGLAASNTARTFTIRESIDGVDRNGDGDTNDFVMTFRDRGTGKSEVLGATAGCGGLAGTPEGRAAVRVNEFPFSFPAVSVEGNVLAFLESEAGQSCDVTTDNDQADSILRVFRIGTGETAIARPRAVDAALRIDDAPLEVSNGRVYVRTSEPEMASRSMRRASSAFGGGESTTASGGYIYGVGGVSADGRRVVFSTDASDLLAPGLDTNGLPDVFVYDRVTQTTTRVSEPTGGGQGNNVSAYNGDSMISADGNWVVFGSHASNLAAGDGNFVQDIFLHDLQTGETELVSQAFGGGAGNNFSITPTISDDGQVIAFASRASDLLPPGEDTNGATDFFVYDRGAGTTERVSVRPDGTPVALAYPNRPALSGNGRFVLFSTLENIDPDDLGPGIKVYVRDRLLHTTELVSRRYDGLGTACAPYGGISSDGRFVLLTCSGSDMIAPGKDTNLQQDVFVRDRLRGVNERVSVATDGTQANGYSSSGTGGGLSADGRFAAFLSYATTFLPGVSNGQVWVHDRVTGTTELGSVADDGTSADVEQRHPIDLGRRSGSRVSHRCHEPPRTRRRHQQSE